MEIKFLETAGSDDFHQDLIDIINVTYFNVYDFMYELCHCENELCLKRNDKDGFLFCSVSNIDLKNEIITISWVGVGG